MVDEEVPTHLAALTNQVAALRAELQALRTQVAPKDDNPSPWIHARFSPFSGRAHAPTTSPHRHHPHHPKTCPAAGGVGADRRQGTGRFAGTRSSVRLGV